MKKRAHPILLPDARHAGPFRAVRQATLDLVAPLSAEDCAVQSMPDASPVKVASGAHHLVLRDVRAGAARARVPRLRCGLWLSLQFVLQRHRQAPPAPRAGHAVATVAGRSACLSRVTSTNRVLAARALPAGLLELGLHHEQQHQELILTDLKHLLSRNPLKPAYQKTWPLTPIRACARSWLRFRRRLARDRARRRGLRVRQRDARVIACGSKPFEMASHPVTHGDFVDFIDDGGYRRPELWLSARLGHGAGARLAGAASTGNFATAHGTRSRCMAWPLSTAMRRSAT